MSSEEIGRRRRKPKRRRMEGERRPRPRSREWSPAVQLGDHIEIRAKAPYRAASLEVKPGLYVVGELRADALEFGAGALDVTKSLLKAASKGVESLSKDSSAKKKTSSSSRGKALSRREAAVLQREQAVQLREAKVQRAEERIKRCYASLLASDTVGAPLKAEAVPWIGDEDLLGAETAVRPVKLEEPDTLAYRMWKFHQYDE